MHVNNFLAMSGLLLLSSWVFASDINEKQWNLVTKKMCPQSASYLVNGGNTEVLVSGTFENGDEIYFIMPPKSSHTLNFAIQSNAWFYPNTKHSLATLTATNAMNGEKFFSGKLKLCENLVLTGPVRMFAYQMNWG